MAKKRTLPPQVMAARLAGDTVALSAMGRSGNRIKAKIRAVKMEQATKAATAEAARIAEIDTILAEDIRQMHLRDAYAHHMQNLAGASQD